MVVEVVLADVLGVAYAWMSAWIDSFGASLADDGAGLLLLDCLVVVVVGAEAVVTVLLVEPSTLEGLVVDTWILADTEFRSVLCVCLCVWFTELVVLLDDTCLLPDVDVDDPPWPRVAPALLLASL